MLVSNRGGFLKFVTQQEINAFYVVFFEPIKIRTVEVTQNDLLHLIFLNDIYVVFKKLTGVGLKMVIPFFMIFIQVANFEHLNFQLLLNKITCMGHYFILLPLLTLNKLQILLQ